MLDIELLPENPLSLEIEDIPFDTSLTIDIDPGLLVTDKHYTHHQLVANSIWTVNHNLNKHPTIAVIDSSNKVVIGDIIYLSVNSLTISFTSAFAGKAYCN